MTDNRTVITHRGAPPARRRPCCPCGYPAARARGRAPRRICQISLPDTAPKQVPESVLQRGQELRGNRSNRQSQGWCRKGPDRQSKTGNPCHFF